LPLAVIVKAWPPLTVAEIVCVPLELTIVEVAPTVIAPE